MTGIVTIASASPTPPPQSATALLRSLKSAQDTTLTARIAIAQSALSGTAVPRIKELLRQWILDEWLSPYKGPGRPPLLQREYHDLYELLGDDGTPPPFAILLRSFAELREHGVDVREAPILSLKRILTQQNQYAPLARWIELWSAMIFWVADVRVEVTGSTDHDVRAMSDVMLQHMIGHKEIAQDDPHTKLALIATLPYLSVIEHRQTALGSHLVQTSAELLVSLPTNAFDRFLDHSITSAQHTAILGVLPLLLEDLARVRLRQRHAVFVQPTGSKTSYESYIAQSLYNTLYEDFQQISAFLDGVSALGVISTEGILQARLSCWNTLHQLDVRVDGNSQWSQILSKTARDAKATLASTGNSTVRVSLALLACLSKLDYQATAVKNEDIQICFQRSYIRSVESVELLNALASHHRLTRRPAEYVATLCQCLTSLQTVNQDTEGSHITFSEAFVVDLHDLVTNGGAEDECWRILLQASESLLLTAHFEDDDRRLALMANIVASLVSRGCTPARNEAVGGVWVLLEDDIPARKRKSTSHSQITRLSAILTVRSVLNTPDNATRPNLMRCLSSRSWSLEHDITLIRYLFNSSSSVRLENDLMDELLHRLAQPASQSYWRILNLSILKRIQISASDEQLDQIGRLITLQPSEALHLLQSAAFWDLPRLPDTITQLATQRGTVLTMAQLAIPSDMQTGDFASNLIEQCAQGGMSIDSAELWLAQASLAALMEIRPSTVLQLAIDEGLRPLLDRFLCRLTIRTATPSGLPEALLDGVSAMHSYIRDDPSPTLPIVSALFSVLRKIATVGVKWSSMPALIRDQMREVCSICRATIIKVFASEHHYERSEMKAQAWVDAKVFSLWSGDDQPVWDLPYAILASILTVAEPSNPALPLRVTALQDQKDDLLIAMYQTLRNRAGNVTKMDTAMSTIIQASSTARYSGLWLYATRQPLDGTLLSLLLRTDREGSGKIVASHLSKILVAVQAGQVDSSVLVSLWQYRAMLFNEGQAMDAWSAFTTRLTGVSDISDIVLLLDAATTFCQQRSDLVPTTTLSITSAVCALFNYLRGAADEVVAQKTARFLDTLGRGGPAAPKRKSGEASSRQRIARALAPHIPVILVSYARSATDPIKSISSTVRRIIDPSVAEMCTTIDASVGKAFDSIGLPYGLGEGLAGEAEAAVWAGIWRSWKKKRYIGQG